MGNNNSNSGGKKPSTPKPDEKHDPDGSITKKRKVIQINISILGNRGVGKTSLGMKFIYDSFVIPVDDSDSPFLKGYCRDLDPAEAGEKAYKHLHVGDSYTAKIQIMDTMGAEKFTVLTETIYTCAHIIFLCFAINDLSSFDSLSSWFSSTKDHTDGKDIEPLIVIVGTKSDLQSAKRIEKDRALQFCETHNILYFETSAKNGQSVNELFQNSCDELLRRIEKKEIKNTLGIEREED